MAHYLDPKHDLTFKRVFGEHKHLCMSSRENEHTREALGYMEKAAYTKEQLAQYDKWKVDLMSAQSMIDDAETRGEAIGLEKGRIEGEAIGERNKTLKIAKNALKMGLSEEEVINLTGLTKDEIISLI